MLSRELGRIVVIAPGCAKIPNRFGGAIEPLNYGFMSIYRSMGDRFYLKESEIKNSFWNIRGSMEALKSALLVLSIVNRLSPLELPEPRLFDLLHSFLKLVNEGKNPALMKLAAILKALDLLGFLPSLDSCSSCSGKISKEAFIKRDNPAPLCGVCSGGEGFKLVDGLPFLQVLKRTPLPLCDGIGYSERALKEATFYIDMLLKAVLGGVGFELSGSNI